MKKTYARLLGFVGFTTLLPLAGCVTRPQGVDFIRTEFARVTADVVGQIFLIFVQSISQFAGA